MVNLPFKGNQPIHEANRGSRKQLSLISILMFLVGALSTFDISLVGRVTIAELVSFACIPFLWFSNEENWTNQNFKTCLGILALMMFGVVLSDLVNHNSFWYSVRAFARHVFALGFFLFFIPILKKEPLSIIAMIYGQVIGGIIKYSRPSSFEDEMVIFLDTYQGIVFRVMPLITAVLIAVAVYIYPKSRVMTSLLFVAGAFTVLVLGAARSSVLPWIAGAIIFVILALFKSRKHRRINLTKMRITILTVVLIIGISIVYFGYLYSAPRGLLGEQQLVKFEEQSNNRFGVTPWGLILSGRTPVYGAILGVMDRPVFGFGSWRHDLTSVYVVDAISEVGVDATVLNGMRQGGQMIGAGHSVFFQAWVENGFIVAIGYAFVFLICFRVFIYNLRYENRITPYVVYTFVSFSWAFFFSPPGLGLRFLIGFWMAMYVVFLDRRRPLNRMPVLP